MTPELSGAVDLLYAVLAMSQSGERLDYVPDPEAGHVALDEEERQAAAQSK